MPTISAPQLRQLVTDIFARAGCSQTEAQRIAHYLVEANLAGHDSHGVIRVARYIPLLREGAVRADQKVELITDTPVIAVVDGKYGFGQTVAPQAVEIGIAKCKSLGLAAVGLRNSAHIGRAGDWAEMAAQAGLISIHFVNARGSVLVAPFGSTQRRFSTAPYCVGVPLAGREPLVLDFATSLVAEGKVFVASQGGRAVPPDALIGPDGATSNDPRLLYGNYQTTGKRDLSAGQGALRTFGDHKGSGLALMCELLGGALSGNGCTQAGQPLANGMFSIYVDPKQVDAQEFFPQEALRYFDFVKQAKPATADKPVLMPGEPERISRAQRMRDGVPLPEQTWHSLIETGQLAGLDAAWVEQAGRLLAPR